MDLKSTIRLLESEGHSFRHVIQNQAALRRASLYLDTLCGYAAPEFAGLIEHELFFEVNRLVLNQKYTPRYSLLRRATMMYGSFCFYQPPEDLYEQMQWMIDRYNHDLMNKEKDPALTLTFMIMTFLRLHPFGDGNGRTMKLILWYILKSRFGLVDQLHFLPYEQWCSLLHNKQFHELYQWVKKQIKSF